MADKKWGKGKDKIDDEDVTFQRMVAKVSAFFPSFSCFFFFFSFYLMLISFWKKEIIGFKFCILSIEIKFHLKNQFQF